MNGRGNSRGISTAIFGETSEEIYGRIYEENFVDISKGNLRTRLPLDISTTRKIFSKEHRRNAGWDHWKKSCKNFWSFNGRKFVKNFQKNSGESFEKDSLEKDILEVDRETMYGEFSEKKPKEIFEGKNPGKKIWRNRRMYFWKNPRKIRLRHFWIII